jgi:hypothetical protein
MFKFTGHPFLVKNSLFHWSMVSIALLYLYLLAEHITTGMNLFFLSCLLLSSFQLRANTPVKILLISIICVHHGFFYGLKLTTEAALNFILGMTGVKMLEQQEFRDRHLLLFIFLLLLNAALLFEKSIFIFFYVVASLLCLVFVMSTPRFEWKYLWNALKSIAIVSPAIIAAYFFFPRWNSQIFGDFSIAGNAPEIHKIGLSLDVNFKHLNSIEPNSALSFLAYVEVLNRPLYWRSHTLTQTDGWNWERSTSDTLFFKAYSNSSLETPSLIKQRIQLETNQRYFVGLDRSMEYRLAENTYIPDSYALSYQFPNRSTLKSYEAYSYASAEIKNQKISPGDKKSLLELPIDKSLFPELKFTNAFELQKSLREHFRSMQFIYSYEPGLISSVEEFIQSKKGFCSHFASYTALLLRANNVPTRLVSGYLGGQRSPFGDYYRVVENDAHVWVEAFWENSWVRLDPTLWVAGIRADGGNSALIANNKNIYSMAYLDFFMEKNFPSTLKFLSELKFGIEKMNSVFQFWLENFNLTKQREIAKQWQLTINEFYLIGILTMFISVAIMTAWILYRNQLYAKNKNWILWQKFWMSIEKKFPELKNHGIHWGELEKLEYYFNNSKAPDAKKWQKVLHKLKRKIYNTQ